VDLAAASQAFARSATLPWAPRSGHSVDPGYALAMSGRRTRFRDAARGGWLLACAAAVLVGAGAALLRGPAPARAQEAAATVYVSGLRVDGTRARAVVRLTNASPNLADVFALHYTIQAGHAGEPLSLPGAGFSGAPLAAGKTLEIDLGEVVTAYRASFGLTPYRGTVRFVAWAEDGAYSAFGPETVHVTAVMSEGKARFEPLVEWR
jgi:hypothetical protein